MLAIAVGLGVAATGCGSTAATGRHHHHFEQTASPRALIVKATLEDVSASFGWNVPLPAKWLDVVYTATDPAQGVEAQWEGELLAENDRLAALSTGGEPVDGVGYSIKQPDGTVEGLSDHVLSPAAIPAPPPVDILTTEVKQGLANLGLTEASLQVTDEGGLGVGVVVVGVASGDSKAFVRAHPFAAKELLPEGAADSLYLEVDDSTGKPVEADGYVMSGNANYFWTDPAFGCFSASCPLPASQN